MKDLGKSILAIIACFFSYHLSLGQDSSIPNWIIEDWEIRTQGDGVWIADNSEYKSENEPFEAYGLKWEWGLGKKSLKGQLYCIREGVNVGTVWQFIDFWDPATKQAKLIQIGSDGTVGQGNVMQEKNGGTKSIQKFVSPDGSSFTSGHKSEHIKGESHVSSFDIAGDKWTPRRSYVWKNVAARTNEVSTPEEYKKFEFLIGTWRVKIGEDRFVNMSFDWSQNKLMITYKSTNPVKPGEAQTNEVEGIITYHGTKEQIVFMSAYLGSYPTLMNEGHFEFPKDGVIERIFTVFYKEGSGIPWTDGEKAPKGGKPVDFKQIWTKVDDNTFSGEFFWKKNGKWEHPMPEHKDGKKEVWKRVL